MQKITKRLIAVLSLASVSLCSTNVILATENPQQLTYDLTNVQVDLSKVQVNPDGKFEIPIGVADAYEISQIGIYDINNIDNSDIAFDFTGLDGATWDYLDNVLTVDQLPKGETILGIVAKLKEESKAVANVIYKLENLSVEPITEYPVVGKDFSFKLVAEQGYRLPQRIAVMPQDSSENPEYTYDNLTGLVTIKALKTDSYGYLKVNASAVKNVVDKDFKVQFDLKNVELTEVIYSVDEQGTYFVDFSFITTNGYRFPSLASVKTGSKVDQFWFENIENCNSNITVAEYVQSGSVGNMRITGIQKDTVIKLASYYRF